MFPIWAKLKISPLVKSYPFHNQQVLGFSEFKTYADNKFKISKNESNSLQNNQSFRSHKIVCESRMNDIKHMTNPYVNSRTKITEKKTSGQIDEVEQFVQSDVRKMNIR